MPLPAPVRFEIRSSTPLPIDLAKPFGNHVVILVKSRRSLGIFRFGRRELIPRVSTGYLHHDRDTLKDQVRELLNRA